MHPESELTGKTLRKMHSRRAKLRKEMTPAEAFLWNLLKERKLCGKKFRRQHSIGFFVFDFFCAEENLAIELDGHGHFFEKGRRNDAAKIAVAAARGVRVLHIENHEVFLERGRLALEKIAAHFLCGPSERGSTRKKAETDSGE